MTPEKSQVYYPTVLNINIQLISKKTLREQDNVSEK